MSARARHSCGRCRGALLIALLIGGATALAAQDARGGQDNLLQILRRNFAVGSLDVKIQVIEDAASMERGGFGPLDVAAQPEQMRCGAAQHVPVTPPVPRCP